MHYYLWQNFNDYMKRIFLVFVFVFCVFKIIECAVPAKIIENIERILEHDKNLPIISIAGCPGVGKSTFATMLLQELSQKNIQRAIIGIDDFVKAAEERKSLKNELDIMRIDWKKLHRVLQEIRQGTKQIKVPKINQLTK